MRLKKRYKGQGWSVCAEYRCYQVNSVLEIPIARAPEAIWLRIYSQR